MIPKVIHYIWLGGKPLPKIAEKCIKSWKKYCPDYEIKRWDESNIDLESCSYAKEAYNAKKYAFTADYFRFDILYKEGGIYLDIDVELLKPLDSFLNDTAIMSFENDKAIAPGLILACEKGCESFNEIVDLYKKDKFILDEGTYNLETVCDKITKYLLNFGLELNNKNQKVKEFSIYSSEYFCPKSLSDGKIRKTKNTVAIHYYFASWQTKSNKFKSKILQFIKRILGEKTVNKLKRRRGKNNEGSSLTSK